MTTINTQQVLTQAIVGVMTVNIMASAMGIMMGTMGASAYTTVPSELKGTQAAVRELRLAFGGNVVNRAVKNVGTDSMLTLAQETERLIVEDMNTKYGTLATEAALAAASPGNVAEAKEIANTLARKGIKAENWKTWLDTAPIEQKEQVVKKAKMKSTSRKPVRDLRTGIVYKSHSAVGKALAAEYGQDPNNTFAWYAILKEDPDRFADVGLLSSAPISSSSAYIPPKAISPAPSGSLTLQEALREYEKAEEAGQSAASLPKSRQARVDHMLPEWKQVLNRMSMMDIPGNKLRKPKKFVEKITIIPTPANFSPSSQGDYAFTNSYSYDGVSLAEGPSYTYDSMMNVVGSPYERTVDVPRGTRVWVCTYDGQWGGYWSRVDVYVNADDLASSPGMKLL